MKFVILLTGHTRHYIAIEFDKEKISDILDDTIDEKSMNEIYNNLQFKYFSNNNNKIGE